MCRVHDGPKPSQLRKFTLKTDVYNQNVVWTLDAEIVSFREVLSKFAMYTNIIVQGGLITACPHITICVWPPQTAVIIRRTWASATHRCGRYIVRSVWRGDTYK